TVGANNADTTFAGSFGGNGTITKVGSGTLTLSGDNSAYSETISVSAGAIRLGLANALAGSTVTVNVNGGLTTISGLATATLGATNGVNTNGLAAATLGELAGGSNFAIGATALSVGANNTDSTYSGILSGTGSLIKVGTGTLTLANAGNTYSGGTTVNGGTLRLV